jgi:hypothetical protein
LGGAVTRFVFLTKTRWDEPPRIRHQLARLLADAGHEICFFEKPAPVWRGLPEPHSGAARITVAHHHELIHHKLRLLPAAHRLNAAVVSRSLRAAVRRVGFGADAVVVNFNYDYWFLRRVFPRQRLITMINDDFVSTALFGFTAPLRWALARTCRDSDCVLTVSEPLQEQLAQYCRAQLFLPWADRPYTAPDAGTARNTLLFWGFINNKVDFALLRALSEQFASARPDLKLMLVGPVEQGVDDQLGALRARGNVEVLPATALDRLPLRQVLAALIPYRTGVAEIEAIALPNKALQLLARGLPLLIAGMPRFISKPFVFRLEDGPAAAVLERIAARFADLQTDIREFVADNCERARLTQFLQLAA